MYINSKILNLHVNLLENHALVKVTTSKLIFTHERVESPFHKIKLVRARKDGNDD